MAFAHLGFPDYFRVELSWAKILGVVLLRSRLCADRASFGGRWPGGWGWAAAAGVLWGLSYSFWRRAQATPASA